MSPGALEEIGNTVRSLIDALRSQPLALAMVMTNIIMLCILAYVVERASAGRAEEMRRMVEMQQGFHELIDKCIK